VFLNIYINLIQTKVIASSLHHTQHKRFNMTTSAFLPYYYLCRLLG